MKRKVVQNGVAFQTSLPIDWVREQGLKAKDEIDVEVIENNLVISAKMKKDIQRTTLKCELPVVQRLIPALYRIGYDEIEVFYKGKDELKQIQDVLGRELIGHEIVQHKASSCIIRSLTTSQHDTFENLLNRVFLLLLTNAKDCATAIRHKDTETLKEIIQRDKNINKLTNFCERILVKNSDVYTKDSIFLFNMIKEIENLADEYKYLAQYCLDTKKLDFKKGLPMLDKINALLDNVYTLFHKFDVEEAAQLELEFLSLKKKLIKYQQDFTFGLRLMSIFRRMHVLLAGHYCLKVK